MEAESATSQAFLQKVQEIGESHPPRRGA